MSDAESMCVGIVLERCRLNDRWAAETWKLADVLPGRPVAEPWTLLAEGEGWQRYYAGAVELQLFRSETANYRDNLESARPAVYVILRRAGNACGIELHGATVDPGEIEAHSDAGDDLIEAFPLPASVALWMRDFVERHHVEKPFYKRQRDRVDPEALASRRVVARRA